MKYRHLFSIVCFLLMGVVSAVGQTNTISIPDVSVAKGKSINLPINLDNTTDVVAIQFTLSVPNGLTLNTATAALTDRSDEHSVTLQSVGSNKYMAMVFSSKNKAIKGRTGKLLSVSLTASNSLEEGTEHQLSLSDVVIGARDGSNLTTGYNAGKVTIAKSPDLEVSQITTNETAVNPGEKFNVCWTVSNIGDLPTTGGWSEQILLKSDEGSTKLLGKLYNDEILNAGGVVSRNAELNIPAIIGMDGNCYVVVKLVPNSNAGEPSWLQENNVSQTANTISVKKQLSLSPDNVNVDESNAKPIRFKLSRSGNTMDDEVFTLSRNADERIVFPESVTIEKGLSSTYFYAQVVANNILDNDSIVRFSISGNNYSEILSNIKIEDDTYPSLNISTTAQDVTEGGNIVFTVSTQRVSQSDIEVKITCDFTKHFKIPSNIIIPAGQNNVEVKIETVENDIPNIEEVVTFTATAPRHNTASINTVLIDNDIPTLQLEITPTAVSEAAGPLAVTAKLRRIDNIDKVVTVKLSDDSNGGIYYGRQTIILEKGVEEATINLGPIDNAIVDGERIYNISAAVWIASCSCNANNGTSGGVLSIPLTVYDNDGPTLSMTSTSSVLNEGSEMTVTVKRNTSTTEQMVVYLSSDHDADLEYPTSIVIPAGESKVSFSVKSKGNEITGDGFTATLSASAEDLATGNIWFSVSDQTLPDARIESLSTNEQEYISGDEITFTATISNRGNAELPSNTLVQLFKSGSQSVVAEVYTSASILAGETQNVNIVIMSSTSLGEHSYYAKVNPNNVFQELDCNNNSSVFAKTVVFSPFNTSTEVSKTIIRKNEEIEISGKASGRNVANTDIDVYVINRGYRHVIATRTDDNGHFSVKYTPFENQTGHFVVGACYSGDKVETEQCSFDIYAIDVTNNSRTCDILKGDSYTSKFVLTNNGVLPLTNVKARLVSILPNVEITYNENPVTIASGESTDIVYTIKGIEVSPALVWQTLKMEFSCDEGAVSTSDINYYIRAPKAQLKSDAVCINTSVTIGETREFHINVSNIGGGETGKISFALPSWMRLDGMQTINSLSTGENAEVVLLISTNEQMQANVPVTGSIGVNCEYGDGFSIPFSVEPVSSYTGVLRVDVCDEFTYYTEEAPHVSNAQIVLRHPTTGSIIASGSTDEKGIFEVELAEGYYALSVTANKHENYNNNVYIDPERTRSVVVDLGYTAITCNWDVVETEIEDEYKLTTRVNYETNVPVPCVVLGMPKKIDGDNMRVGESTLINITVTNKGLITALNNNIQLPDDTDEWRFESLVSLDPFDLAPQQSVVLPVRITRLSDASQNSARFMSSSKAPQRGPANDFVDNSMKNFQNCMAHVKDTYEALCGSRLRENESVELMAMKMCGTAAYGAAILNYVSSLFNASGNGPGSGSGVKYPVGDYDTVQRWDNKTIQPVVSEQSFNMCDTCDARKSEDLFNVLIGKTFLGPVNDGMNEAYDIVKRGGSEETQRLVVTAAELDALRETLLEAAKAYAEHRTGWNVSNMWDFGENLWNIIEVTRISSRECPEQDNTRKQRVKSTEHDRRGWQQEYDQAAALEADYLENYYNILIELFGDSFWLGNDFPNKLAFATAIAEKEDISDQELLSICPSSVTLDKARDLYNRINGFDENNTIDRNKLVELVDRNLALNEDAVSEGYESLADKFVSAYNICVEKYKEKSSSVCASISLQFSQKMVMTRQAFRGTLTVFNGNETTAMSDVKLELVVKDENGNIATPHEFQINPETLTGFEGDLDFEDSWKLDAQQTGVATVMFIPTKYAAPTVERPYSFSGTLSYIDPFTGLPVTRDLAPVTLTVKPSPNLDLTYFMQRDIKGDDPLTEEIEPSEDAEFSLLINNIGYGEAKDVKMFTEQPKIIDNEKGLLIDFELMSSQLNGGEKTLALGGTVATDFGTIPAMSTSVAQWWIRSSLLGHFTDYNVEATHVTSYGNPDLSLLNDVTIHELIRSIDVEDGNAKLVGFMTNDIADAEDMPDMLYLSNGEIEPITFAQNININKVSDTDYSLTVSTNQNGWNYGNIVDPTYGVSTLKSVVRQSDGKEMSLRNFWQTDRTLRDGKDPLYENRIHFADNIMSANGETYVLTFEPTPEVLLEVASIEGVPEEGSLSVEPLNNIKVMFNKYIDPATFTTDDISLAVQGIKQDVSSVSVSTDDNKTFMLDLSLLNENVGNGYFVLTINTSDIKDVEGYLGKNDKQVGWVMFRNGLVALSATTYPTSAGVIQKLPVSSNARTLSSIPSGENCAEYGSTIKMMTVPNKGYEFRNWTINGDIVSSDPILEYVALGDMDIKANYVPKTYSVTISESLEGGVITGAASGVYSYGDTLNLAAEADEDFIFDSWEVNNQNMGNDNEISIIVNESKDIKANFRRDVFLQSITMSRGWNWVSSYVNEPIPVSTFLGNITHIVSQFDEIVNDPVYGMIGGIEKLLPGVSYKMDASYSSMKSFKGHLHDLTNSPIELRTGWNWISYPYIEEKEINEVLNNASEGDYITSQFGFSEFRDGYWEGTLSTLNPGYGYIYKSSTDKTLEFDFSRKQSKARVMRANSYINEQNFCEVDAHKYPSTMNIVARISTDAENFGTEKYRIYAFAGSELRGESRSIGDNHYLTIYGDNATTITFVVEDITTGDTFFAKETVIFNPDVVGSRKAPFTITISGTTAINNITDSSRKMKIYSIEGVLINSEATTESLKKLSRGIYIIDGQKFMVK